MEYRAEFAVYRNGRVYSVFSSDFTATDPDDADLKAQRIADREARRLNNADPRHDYVVEVEDLYTD